MEKDAGVVNREIPFDGLPLFFDHCETISDRNIERIKSLGGGIAVQNGMAFLREYFVNVRAPSRRSALLQSKECWRWEFR